MRTVALGDTFYIDFPSRAFATGIPTILAGTPVIKAFELDALQGDLLTGITWAARTETSLTMINAATIVATAGNGYAEGKVYSLYVTTGTVGGVSAIGEKVGEFRVESAAERVIRLFGEYIYRECTVATVTGNTTTAVNMTEIVDANTPDDAIKNVIYAIRDSGNDVIERVVCTGFTNSSMLAVMERVDDRGAMGFTVAAGDMIWPTGEAYSNVMKQNNADMLGAGTSGDKWRSA